MIDWRAHRLWIGVMAIAFVIGIGHAPLIGLMQTRQQLQLAALKEQYKTADDALKQLRADIAATEKLKTQIDEEEVEKSLAPVDRLKAAQILERRAAESRLSHFSYSFSPEHKTQIDTIGAGKQNLAVSDLSITADAPTDIDGYIFTDAARQALPGRLALREFSLERTGAADAPLTAANLRLTIKAEWLSNGATQNLAEISR